MEIQQNGREITKNKLLNKTENKDSKPCTHRRISFKTTCPHVHNRIQDLKTWWMKSPSVNQLVGRTHQRKTPKQSKPKDIHRANINDSPRPESSGDQGDCTTESHRYSTTEVHTINPGSQNRSQEESHKQWEDKETIPK